MKKISEVMVAVLIACLPVGLVSGEQAATPVVGALKLLKSTDQATRIAAGQALLDDRKRMVAALVAILDENEPDALWVDTYTTSSLAIEVLGEMRAPEAVPALLKWAVPPKGAIEHPLAALSPCPAYLALVKIGKAAEPSLIDSIRMKKENPSWELGLSVLKEIEGSKCAAIILEEAIAKEEAGASAKEHLQAALKKLKEEK